MKQFTFKINKGNKNNVNNSNVESDLSSFISNNIANKYPYLF